MEEAASATLTDRRESKERKSSDEMEKSREEEEEIKWRDEEV